MDLSQYIKVLRAHWLGVLLIVTLAVAGAAGFTLTRPQIYAANSTGFVTTGSSSDPSLASVNDSVSKSRAKSYVDIATSRPTAQRVIDELGLSVSPSALIGNITVEQPLDTVLIKITARSDSPTEAQKLADAWVVALAAQVEQVENPNDVSAGPATRLLPVESAELPTTPISPRPSLNVAIGLAVGLILGLAYALMRSQLDRRLRDPLEVERAFNVPVVGAIPEANELRHRDGERAPLAVQSSPFGAPSASAEAIRKLRTNLSYVDVDNPPRVIVVTSPQQSDGKSTLAGNLAAAIAVGGQRVTLVDADLRRPTVATSFGLVEGAGLTDVVSGQAAVEDVIQEHGEIHSLYILAAGDIPPNPSELLGSQAMRTLLRTLARDSIVIVDAPPLLPVTDAAVVAGHSDGVLVAIRSGSTLDTELRLALDHLDSVHAKVLGVVFNRVTGRGAAGAYYGTYYRAAHTATAPKTTEHRGAKRRRSTPAA